MFQSQGHNIVDGLKGLFNSDTINLKRELEDEMGRYKKEMQRIDYQRKYRTAEYISLDFIADLYRTNQPSKLRLSLESDLERLTKDGREELVKSIKLPKLEEWVQTRACKLYAILLLVNQSQVILSLYKRDHPVTDDIFEELSEGDKPYCSLEQLKASKDLCDFADDFFQTQWYIPPVLRRDREPQFPVTSFRFPFIGKPDPVGHGGYAQVYKVRVAHGHLKLTVDDGYDKDSVVTHKEMELLETSKSIDKVMREVRTIRARSHPNIVTFFACFIAGRENPIRGNEVTCFHMLFEHTEACNMKNWLEQDSTPNGLTHVTARQNYIMNTIENLVTAVAYIHKEINGKTAYHHDLKPENILLFDGPPAVWKICDFGMAHLKEGIDNSRTSHNSSNGFGTYDYQPPEYLITNEIQKHGRQFDVWSLGCILLELSTVWKFGWSPEGIPMFKTRRAENTQLDSKSELRLPRSRLRIDRSFNNNTVIVHEWIRHLREGEVTGSSFLHLLDLVSEMLLARAQRIYVWEVHMDLYEMAHPHLKPEDLKSYFWGVAQSATRSLNNLSNEHNPLKRAISRKKGWQVDVLKLKEWSVDEPKPATLVAAKIRTCATTLSLCSQMNEFRQNRLYGRHELDRGITERFRVSSCVGLYGLSGMGKSHLAYEYVRRIQDTDSEQDKRHTFWVEAGTETRFEESIGKMGGVVSLAIGSSEDLLETLQKWLGNARNGPWILVLDGLDKPTMAAQVARLIPTNTDLNNAQILITTKDRAILDGLEYIIPPGRQKARLHVGQLPTSYSRLVFQWHNQDVLPDDREMDDLLMSLSTPTFTKAFADYAAHNNHSVPELYDRIKTARKDGSPFRFPNEMFKGKPQLYSTFEPFHANETWQNISYRTHNSWPTPELKLLGELSCFDKDNIAFQLIYQNYYKVLRLGEMLGHLENCSLVLKVRDSNTKYYVMHEIIQESMQRWVRQNMGVDTLMDLYQIALIMLLLHYQEHRRTKANVENIYRSSYLWKVPFMAHFDRFLGFVKELNKDPNQLATTGFICRDEMVKSVITFAQVYLEERRYNDAACVLEFTRKLYKGAENRSSLIRHLCVAYTLPPLTNRDRKSWATRSKLLEDVYAGCIAQPQRNREQEWMCLLDLANLHSRALQPENSVQILKGLSEVSIRMRNGGPTISLGHQHSQPPLESSVLKKLAILKCIAEANIHKAKAACQPPKATEELRVAKSHLEHAKNAILSWLSGEDKWVADVEEQVAGVLCEMHELQSTRQALKIYERLLKRLRSEFNAPDRPWSQTRVWELECRVADAHLRLGPSACLEPEVETAFLKLKSALEYFQEYHEKKNGKHDEHTLVCAHLLQEHYENFGRNAEAEEIKQRYDLRRASRMNTSDVFYEQNDLDRSLLVLSLLIIFAACLFHHLWYA
ncbi:uncharacterized protein K460DRAFT_408803 [Cucurbitaria berberidis CBS 394.84]|uniref:non-specific serine/threonine protein kinase n=1 Tax=Cucurbitaria berberidis CBS 394.84 TaxID=1168544 RepID=A0A9P4G9T3_9PLEO|nr:uncharacterized protein K460DRAFT_408803 [Cucurbitaria berberidis CBS 394.84]KAF1841329.1 hypothetical protein K460DRAFT_408803 [Cucurbitaria berberidis CBS 394.84]